MDRAVVRGVQPVSVGADKGYDTRGFIAALDDRGVAPHVARNIFDTGTIRRSSAVTDEIAASDAYAMSQRKRKLIEEGFGWMKTFGGLRRTRYRGVQRTQVSAQISAAAYNLLRMSRLVPMGTA